jgi:hypothetical protein
VLDGSLARGRLGAQVVEHEQRCARRPLDEPGLALAEGGLLARDA